MLLIRFSDRDAYLLELTPRLDIGITESSSLVTIPDYEVSTVTSRYLAPSNLRGKVITCIAHAAARRAKCVAVFQLLLAGARVNKP